MTTSIKDLKPMFNRLRLSAMYEHAESMLEDVQTSSMAHTDWLKERS